MFWPTGRICARFDHEKTSTDIAYERGIKKEKKRRKKNKSELNFFLYAQGKNIRIYR